MTRVITLCVLGALALGSLVAADTICDLEFCECVPSRHPAWITVNCTLPANQNLDILEGDLPDNVTDLIINGAEALMFGVNSLSRLKDARRINIDNTKLILMRKFAAVSLNIVNTYLEINNCETLRVEGKTFTDIKGPLTVLISNTGYVDIESEAFSWLLSIYVYNVQTLQLRPGAFILDPTAANIGQHGPGLEIEFKNLSVPEMTAGTFGSSAASIKMDSVNVQHIYPDAFMANTYNIVIAVNCSFVRVHGEAFAQRSLIHNLQIIGCKFETLAARALQSAVGLLNITNTMFENIETGAVNITAATVIITGNDFHNFDERGFEFSSWNKFHMENNTFDEVASNFIVASGTNIHEMTFVGNEIETLHENSLSFIGKTVKSAPNSIVYKNNYFGEPCQCQIIDWLAKVLDTKTGHPFANQTYCTVDEFFARCFNVPEQNMLLISFVSEVCIDDSSITCKPTKTHKEGDETEIKNPRFPHKHEYQSLSDRNKKVIGIIIVSAGICVLVALFISLIRWMRRRGYCARLKNFLFSSNSCCIAFCHRMCRRTSSGIDHAGSINQLPVHEYSERHRLNEPRIQEINQETTLPDMYTEDIPTVDKTTQTLPEELTKELLENLKEKLDDPENYGEAREMIEHLYEMLKIEEECCKPLSPTSEENIYELPFQTTIPRVGRNKKKMISVGTRTPSLDKLTPLSPYNRQIALVHEYFEPSDLAIHLYAEIANSERERKLLMNTMPDVVTEQQPIPRGRGPYLQHLMQAGIGSSTSSASSSPGSFLVNSPPFAKKTATMTSNSSNVSAKMINRPLPEKPVTVNLGEGPSLRHS